jgi:endonuclease III
MNVTVDMERARLVVDKVNRAFKSRQGLLSETDDLVENQIPEGVEQLSKDHALFLFYTVANDHGVKSYRMYARAKELFHKRREVFNPFWIVENFQGADDSILTELTGEQIGARYPRQAARTWYLNSNKLIKEYNGDPRELFHSASNARELIKKIKSFRGYGPKIGGMLLRATVGLGFADVTGIEEVLVPVDIHDSRISFFTEILKPKEKVQDARIDYYAYVTQVQRILLDSCNHLGIKWLDTDRALWLIGSRGCVNRRCKACPINNLCTVGKTVLADQKNSQLPLKLLW